MTLDEFMTQWNDGNSRLLVHTSGSTGTPKPLWVEKSRMVASARITCSFLGLRHGDTALLCMPLDFIAGKMMVVRSIVGKLRLLSVQPSSHPLATLTEAPVFAAMVPLQVWNSLQVPEERDLLRQIHHLIIGGGAIDQSLEEELRHFPHAVWSTYGMTETLSHIALRRLSGKEASEWYTPFRSVPRCTHHTRRGRTGSKRQTISHCRKNRQRYLFGRHQDTDRGSGKTVEPGHSYSVHDYTCSRQGTGRSCGTAPRTVKYCP